MEICEMVDIYLQLFEVLIFPINFIIPGELWVIIKEMILNC